MRRTAALLLAGVFVVGCGPSAAQVQRAKTVSYQTDFALVWNAILRAVTKKYRTIAVEDAVAGKIITDWQLIEKTAGDDISSGDSTSRIGGKFFRVAIDVKGGPPWRVTIDGEAAEYKPGLAMLVPFRHGVDDEPAWVMPRIEALYLAVYDSLVKYAVVAEPKPVARSRALDTSRWANLPAEAGQIVATVEAAATKKDPAAVAAVMADPFTSAVGDGMPAERTVALWNADPTLLAPLAQAVGAGCGYDAAAETITCPATPDADAKAQAIFRHAGGRWRLSSFAAPSP